MGMLRNLFARAATFGRKANETRGSVIVHAGQALGPFQQTLGGYIARDVNPYMYEAMREALPVLDGGIAKLVTMDGVVRVRGDNDRVVQSIGRDFLPVIPVNDLEAGFQAFYSSQGNEVYEQGVGIGEKIMDAKGRELIGLRVADSKGIYFKRENGVLETWYRPPAPRSTTRRDGSDTVEAVLRNLGSSVSTSELIGADYVKLDARTLVYAIHAPEADKPYGVSVLRSMEFCTQILLKIQNSTDRVWERWGDPSFQVTYKTKNRALKQEDLDRRRNIIATDFATAISAKRKGNSVDFVQAIGADDDMLIKVIGGDGQVLELEMPARHMLEMIVSKFGLPAWMLGLQWTTAERLAEQQSTVVLQESKTRFERRSPGLTGVVATWLRGRGVTWKPGDWELYQELPNLHDEVKRAQAAFLAAQTELMLRGDTSALGSRPGTDQGAAKTLRVLPNGDLEWPGLDPGAVPIIATPGEVLGVLSEIQKSPDPIAMAERFGALLQVAAKRAA